MLELRLQAPNDSSWRRYVLDPGYIFAEVEAYIERQHTKEQAVRLLDEHKRQIDFMPHQTPIVQLLCL